MFAPVSIAGEEPILEHESIDEHAEHLLGGYAQSKWVAEKLVTLARSRGLPVAIYRPGRITGHSQTGTWRFEDLMCRMIIGCIQLGYVPALIADERVEMTPVDYVSQAIVALSRRKASLGQAFHLFNPVTVSVSSLVTWVNELGYPVQQTTYEAWLDELTRATEGEASAENALAPLAPLFPKEGPQEQRAVQVPRRPFDNRNALLELAGTSIICPRIDARLLATYLSYLVRSGFLPAVR